MAEKKRRTRNKDEEYRVLPYGAAVSTSGPDTSEQYGQEVIAGAARNIAGRARAAYDLATTPSRWVPEGERFLSGLASLARSAVTDPVGTGKTIIKSEAERAQQAASSPGGIGEYAAGFVDPLRMARVLRGRAPDVRELDVYHGTPHRFEPTEDNPLGEFRASQIGTGEGAQAYGHGLYLAESPDVARGYQERLKGGPLGLDVANTVTKALGVNYYYPADSATFIDIVRRSAGKGETAVRDAIIKAANQMSRSQYPGEIRRASGVRELADNKAVVRAINQEASGHLYTADLPDEMIDRMLDWDKPFLDQSDEIKKIAKDNLPAAVYNQLLTQRTGDLVNELARYKGGSVKASELMRQAGIPGIKYLDAGSRGQGGTGTRNFVVFPGEEKKVKILERKSGGGMVENTTHDRKII